MLDPKYSNSKIIFNEMVTKLNNVSNDMNDLKKDYNEKYDKLQVQIKLIAGILIMSFIITGLHLLKVI